MIAFLISIIIISAALYHLLAIYYEIQLAKFILKPCTMVLIILLAIYGSGFASSFSIWVVIALIFSLFGDVFLMLKEKWFVYGLTSFLIAHLFYIVGFWFSFEIDFTTLTSTVIGAVLVVLAIGFFILLLPSVKKQGGTLLIIAVAFYISVISLMVWSAVLIGVPLISIASFLFYISDAVLAFNKFKNPLKAAEYMVMATYFSAQILFALSMV